MENRVITIARSYGSGGRKMGRLLAKELGYEYYDRDAMFTCSAETLFKIASGKTDPILAVTLGKLKVEGSIDKALKLMNEAERLGSKSARSTFISSVKGKG